MGNIDIQRFRKCRTCGVPVMYVGASDIRDLESGLSSYDWLHAIVINGNITLIHDYNGCTDSYPELIRVRGLDNAAFLLQHFYATHGSVDTLTEPYHKVLERIGSKYPTYQSIAQETGNFMAFLKDVLHEPSSRSDHRLFIAYPEKLLLDAMQEIWHIVDKHLCRIYNVPHLLLSPWRSCSIPVRPHGALRQKQQGHTGRSL